MNPRRLGEANPRLSIGFDTSWEDDSVFLEDFLRYHAAVNRPYEPPCFWEDSNEGADELEAWPEARWVSSALGEHSLRYKGGVVADIEGVRLGAKTVEELRRAMAELDIDEEFVELNL